MELVQCTETFRRSTLSYASTDSLVRGHAGHSMLINKLICLLLLCLLMVYLTCFQWCSCFHQYC